MLVASQDLDLPELSNKKMAPGALLHLLQQTGINLLPGEGDEELARVSKVETVEDKCIEDLSLGCRSYFIRSSRWSHQLASQEIMVKVRENMDMDQEFAEDQEKDWKAVVFYPHKVECVLARDSDQNCSRKFVNDSHSHSTFQMLMAGHTLSSQEA